MGSPEHVDSSHFFARFAAFVSLTVGLFVVAGWTLDMDQLTYIVPGWPRMSLLTALSFMLAGAALWLTLRRASQLAIPAAGLLAVIGLLILVRNHQRLECAPGTVLTGAHTGCRGSCSRPHAWPRPPPARSSCSDCR